MSPRSAVLCRRLAMPVLATSLLLTAALHAQRPAPIAPLPDIDPAIASVLQSTLAIDNHAHTVLPPPNDNTDRDYDALPVDHLEPETDPVAFTDSNPQLSGAWKALWGVTAAVPISTADGERVNAQRAAVKRRLGLQYDDWVLAQAGIATQLANRVSMGPGLRAPGFLWVPYADTLLFPLNNAALAAQTPDRAAFFSLEDKLRARYLQQLQLSAMPGTLESYLKTVVTPLLERQHAGGAVAEKFEIAYLRPFGFDEVPLEEAARIYAAGQSGVDRTVPAAEYTRLQDFLFRYIAMECGRLGMPVHLHSSSGSGGYFDIAGVNPSRLEPLFNDPQLRGTRFVLLHGGFPMQASATALLQKPNVYLDLSAESLVYPPRTLAIALRERLELYPGKVLFGTDGYPYSPGMGWEESTWIAARNIRTALGIALSGMLRDGEIDLPRAGVLARMVLRDNAATLYGAGLMVPQPPPPRTN